MGLETEKTTVPTWLIFTGATALGVVVSGVTYYWADAGDTKWVGLIGGVLSGLIVFLLTFVSAVRPLQKLDQLEATGIRSVLNNRHDKGYYSKILKGAKRSVKVMGASCTRFLDDFLNPQSDDHLLIDALGISPKLVIQLLIPADEFMSPNARERFQQVSGEIQHLLQKFDGRIEIRRFPSPAQHSFLVCDDELVAGPIFEGDNSRFAPAVHISARTTFAQKYIEYFDRVWSSSEK